eukprot:3934055-Rhodomonas_salina.1
METEPASWGGVREEKRSMDSAFGPSLEQLAGPPKVKRGEDPLKGKTIAQWIREEGVVDVPSQGAKKKVKCKYCNFERGWTQIPFQAHLALRCEAFITACKNDPVWYRTWVKMVEKLAPSGYSYRHDREARDAHLQFISERNAVREGLEAISRRRAAGSSSSASASVGTLSSPPTRQNSCGGESPSNSSSHMFLEPAPRSVAGHLSQTTMDNQLDRLVTDAEFEEVCFAIAEWIYEDALPFTTPTTPAFQRVIRKLRNSFFRAGDGRDRTMPSRFTFARMQDPATATESGTGRARKGAYLSRKFLKVHEDVQRWMRNTFGVTMSSDGWKTSCGEGINNIVFSNGLGGTVYVASYPVSTKWHTADMILQHLILYLDRPEVVAFSSDSCNVMIKLRRLIREKYPSMFALACRFHYFDLVGKDCVQGIRSCQLAIARSKTVAKFIKNRAAILDQYLDVLKE